MRKTMMGLAVAFAAAVSAAPASACGYSSCYNSGWNSGYSGGLFGNFGLSGCNPCGSSFATPWQYGHLPYAQPYATSSQYYWVNQGPTYSGPGMFAPAPYYQANTVSGYDPTSYSDGYYDGAPATSYAPTGYEQTDPGYQPYYGRPFVRPFVAPRYRYGYGVHRYGYRYGGYRYGGFRYGSAPRYRYGRYGHVAPRYGYRTRRFY
jgi:hypothetical protein